MKPFQNNKCQRLAKVTWCIDRADVVPAHCWKHEFYPCIDKYELLKSFLENANVEDCKETLLLNQVDAACDWFEKTLTTLGY